MDCFKCPEKAVITLQHGSLCAGHFITCFEDKVFKTFRKYNLLRQNDRLCIAASGGKDSLTVLYLTKKFLQQENIPTEDFFALAVDEGIAGYREKTLVDLKKFCQENNVPLHIVSNKEEFGSTLDEAYPKINKGTSKKPCNVCGVWRRYLINKHARRLGATKLITGHNLDDEAQAILMNIFKANTQIAGRLGPITGVNKDGLFVQRIKPLYFCPEKEVRLYSWLKKFQVQYHECPYSAEGYRSAIQDLLNKFEQKYKGTKQGIVNSFLEILPLLKERAQGEIKSCQVCSEPANKEVCNACLLKQNLQNGGLNEHL